MLMSGRKSHVEGRAAVDFCGEAEATSCHSPASWARGTTEPGRGLGSLSCSSLGCSLRAGGASVLGLCGSENGLAGDATLIHGATAL